MNPKRASMLAALVLLSACSRRCSDDSGASPTASASSPVAASPSGSDGADLVCPPGTAKLRAAGGAWKCVVSPWMKSSAPDRH